MKTRNRVNNAKTNKTDKTILPFVKNIEIKQGKDGFYSLEIDSIIQHARYYTVKKKSQVTIASIIHIDNQYLIATNVDYIRLITKNQLTCDSIHIKYLSTQQKSQSKRTREYTDKDNISSLTVELIGNFKLKTGALIKCKSFILKNKSTFTAKILHVDADRISLAGKVHLNVLRMTSSEVFKVDKNADINTKQASVVSKGVINLKQINWTSNNLTLISKDLELDGKLNVKQRCELICENNCQINSTAQLITKKLLVSAVDRTNNKSTLISMAAFTLEANAKLQIENIFIINANIQQYSGMLKANNVEIKGDVVKFAKIFTADNLNQLLIEAKTSIQYLNESEILIDKNLSLLSKTINISGNLTCKKSMYIQADNLNTNQNTQVGSKENIIINVNNACFFGLMVARKNILGLFKNNLSIKELAKVHAGGDLSLQAVDINISGLIANLDKNLHINAKNLTVSKQAQINAKSYLAIKIDNGNLNGIIGAEKIDIKSKSLKIEIHNKINSKHMQLDIDRLLDISGSLSIAETLNIKSKEAVLNKSGSFKAGKFIFVTGSLFSRGEINADLLMIEASNKIVSEKESKTICKTGKIKADSYRLYGHSNSDTSLVLDVVKSVSIDLSGELYSNNFLQVLADSFWNRGRVWAKEKTIISVDKVCVNGFIEADSLTNVISGVSSRICGGNLMITAPCIINLPTCMLVGESSLTVSSFVHIDIAGMTTAYVNSIKTVFHLEFLSISFPNPSKIFKVIAEINAGNFSIVDPGKDQENFYDRWANRLLTLSTGLSLIFPAFASLIQSATNIISLSLQSKAIYREIVHFYESSRNKFHVRDLIPIIVTGISILETVKATYESALLVADQYFNSSKDVFSTFNVEMPVVDSTLILSLLGTTASMFAPSTTKKTVVGIALATHEVSWSINHISVLDYRSDLSTQRGFTVTHKSYYKKIDEGSIFANQLLVKARELYQNGNWDVNNASIKAETYVEGNKGVLHSTQASIEANLFKQKGKVEVSQATVNVDEHEQTSTGSSYYGPNTRFRAKRQKLQSTIEFKQAIIDVEVQEQQDNQAVINYSDGSLFNIGTLNQSNGQILINNSAGSINSLTQENNITIENSQVVIGTHVQSTSGNMKINESLFVSVDSNLSGATKITNSLVEHDNLVINQTGEVSLANTSIKTGNYTTDINSKLTTDNVQWVTKTAKMNGETHMTSTIIEGKENLHFSESANMTAENVLIKAPNINYEAQSVIKEGVEFKADEAIQMSDNCSFTGPGNLYLTSATGTITGSITTGILSVDKADMNDTANLLKGTGQYKNINPTDMLMVKTQEDLKINETIDRDCGIQTVAKSVDIRNDVSSKNKLSFVATEGNVNVDANLDGQKGIHLQSQNKNVITGKHEYNGDVIIVQAKNDIENNGGTYKGEEIFLHTEEGNLRNNGGKIKATEYLQADIAGDIKNIATEQYYWTGNDNIIIWDQAVLQGGKGVEHDGVGALLIANGKVINEASVIKSVGSNEISGKNGIESISKTHTFINYNDGHGNYGQTTQLARAEITSSNGSNVLISENGGINSVGTYIEANKGTDIFAKDKIFLNGVILTDEIHSKKHSLLHKHEHDETHQSDVTTTIVNTDRADIRIHSFENDVTGKGITIINPLGLTEITGKNIELSNTVLDHHVLDVDKRISLNIFGHTVGENNHEPIIKPDPMLTHVDRLAHSSDLTETSLNVLSTGIEAVNTINSLNQAVQNGQVLETLANRAGISMEPSVGITQTKTRSEQNYQTLGNSVIDSQHLVLNAEESVSLTGLPVHAANMDVHAPIFNVNGIPLESSATSRQNVIGVSTSATQKLNVSVSNSRFEENSVNFANPQIKVDNNLNLDVKNMSINNAEVNVGKLSGHIETLTITSTPNSTQSKTTSFSLSTTGSLSYDHGHTDQTRLDQPARLHVHDNIDEDFKVNQIILNGGKLISDEINSISADKIISNPVITHTNNSHKGIGGNVNALFNDTNSSRPIPTLNISDVGGKSIEKQDGVIFGQQGTKIEAQVNGNLHTTSNDGKEILLNKSHKRLAELPLPTENNLKRLKQTFDSDILGLNLRQKTWDTLLAKYPTETKESLGDRIESSHLFSQLVYEEDCGRDKAATRGFTLVDTYKEPSTNSTVAIYVNSETQVGYIAFTGCVGTAWITDAIDIFTGKNPRSVSEPSMIQFIENQFQENSNITFYFTGHSRGGAQASIASDVFMRPAMVFDNPGISPSQNYTFDNVTSFQSTPNLINSIDKTTLRPYNFGTVVQLPPTLQDQAINTGLQLVSNALQTSLTTSLALSTQTFFSHTNNGIGQKVDALLEPELEKKNNYNSSLK